MDVVEQNPAKFNVGALSPPTLRRAARAEAPSSIPSRRPVTRTEHSPLPLLAGAQISHSEVKSRRDFTKQTKAECDKISAALEDGRIKQKVSSAQRDSLMAGGTGAASR